MDPDREKIQEQIAREEARLAEIEGQWAKVPKRIELLRGQMALLRWAASTSKQLSIVPPATAPTMPVEIDSKPCSLAPQLRA